MSSSEQGVELATPVAKPHEITEPHNHQALAVGSFAVGFCFFFVIGIWALPQLLISAVAMIVATRVQPQWRLGKQAQSQRVSRIAQALGTASMVISAVEFIALVASMAYMFFTGDPALIIF